MRRPTSGGDQVARATHLPPPWKDQRAYDRLYDEIDPYGDYAERISKTHVIRIPPRFSAEQVYRRLPSAFKHEFAGYLTRTRIVYWKGDVRSARFPTSKDCTFHSHPTWLGFGEPNLPSLADLRQFLLGRNRRTITVGRSKLWVWDKSPFTLIVAKRLAEWERDNLSKQFSKLTAQGIDNVEAETIKHSLQQIGLKILTTVRGWANWPKIIADELGFQVTVIPRTDY